MVFVEIETLNECDDGGGDDGHGLEKTEEVIGKLNVLVIL